MIDTSEIIRCDPEVLGGAPVFVGTRVPVQNLLDYLEAGDSLDDFLDDFPTVSRDQVVGARSYFLKHGENLDSAALPAPLEIPAIHRAVGVLDMISQSELDRVEYRQRLKRQRDLLSHDKLLIEGAIEQGLERGELIGEIRAIERFAGEPETPREVLLQTPLDQLRARLAELSERVRKQNGAGHATE